MHNETLTFTPEEKAYIEQISSRAQKASTQLRLASGTQKNEALLHLAELLGKNRSQIKNDNAQDMENAQSNGLPQPMVDRLQIDDSVIDAMIQSLHEIKALKDPVKEVVEGWCLPNQLQIQKVRIPIGVIMIIYESRPNVTIDVGALGLKSSNAIILRGGKEAIRSNLYLTYLFQKALTHAKLPSESVQVLDRTDRQLMRLLLEQKEKIDLVVPRGGEGLIRFITENSMIPVVKHDKGVCHIYIHHSAEKEVALNVLINSKTQKPGVCNAAESVIFDQEFSHIDEILQALQKTGVTLHGDSKTKNELTKQPIKDLFDDGYGQEYLSMDISVKVIKNIDYAIQHIITHGSSHSEVIIAQNDRAIQKFLDSLDSAALFVNASSRFHDGGQFGLGAEVGISTGKLHSRGPMGVSDLTTTKYIVHGNGQVRT